MNSPQPARPAKPSPRQATPRAPKIARFSLLEWLFAGSLPKGGSATGLERATARIERQRRAREEAAREAERATRLARLESQSRAVQEQLGAQEHALRTQEGPLQRGLGVEPQTGAEPAPAEPLSIAERLRQGVAKTRAKLSGGLGEIVLGRKEVDKATLEEVEDLLLTADMGPQTAGRLIAALEGKLHRNELRDSARLKEALREEVGAVLGRQSAPPNLNGAGPQVILFAGVNGSGKTTTIGKLGAQYRAAGRRVLLVAGDTFRAAAAEQLEGWAKRSGCEIFRREEGANPSGVIYQALEHALAAGHDLVLCDTAGRLHTKANLMEELKKIKRVMSKLVPAAPQETYLVLDANNGQNAIHQTREFHQAIGVTGLVITKLDGTARGGVIVGIVNEFDLPVRYVGIGEGVADLRAFDPQAFADSLFE